MGGGLAEENSADEAGAGVKKLMLKLRERESIATTQGTFYARHMALNDLNTFNGYFGEGKEKVGTDLKALGELALRTLVCVDKGPEKTPALNEEIYPKLTDDDIQSLAEGVAKVCELGALREGEALEGLGATLFDSLNEQAKRWAESAAKIRGTVEKSFGSLSLSSKNALGDSLTGLSAIRDSLRMSPVVEALRKAQEEQKRSMAPLSGIMEEYLKTYPGLEALRKVQEEEKWSLAPLSGMGEYLKTFPSLEATQKAQENVQRILDALPKKIVSEARWEAGLGKSVSKSDVRFIRPPAFEETAAGRAASRVANAGEESARQLGEVAGLVGQMAERMAELQEVVVTDVLPQWYKNLQDSSDATKTTLKQAERNLVWAKWALIASVVVTILVTLLQLWVAHDYESENDAHQKALVSLIQQQLEATQTLNERLTATSIEVKEQLARLNQAGANPQASQPPAAISLKADKTP